MSLTVIVLAAGQGKRMNSDRPKVLHPIGGRSMLARVLDVSQQLDSTDTELRRVVVYGHGGEQVRQAFAADSSLLWAEQHRQLGTGHAVAQSFPHLPDSGTALVLYADVPLIRAATLQPLIAAAANDRLGLLTVELDDPSGYGRIVREDGAVRRIVEHKDASPEQRSIAEINTGILAAPAARLRAWVQRLDNSNAQGEYYLTDIIEMAADDGVVVEARLADDPLEVQGVNDRIQLAEMERHHQRRECEALMLAGATLADPARVDVRGRVQVGKDVSIDVNVVFEGDVSLGDRVSIGPNCVIRDSRIGADCQIHANSVLQGAELGRQVSVGPFARLRPGTRLDDASKIGNFVETKNAHFGTGSKANHLSYVGDAKLGRGVNIGAGTITCNYDGANKHQTVLDDEVFIGSNTALVAPVRIGKGSTTGAGSTISKDVADDTLALTRGELKQVKAWRRPVKSKPRTP